MMVPTLEAIRGGGGSIKVGTTGTISALMSKELESVKSLPVSVSSGKTTPKKSKPKPLPDEATSSTSTSHLKDQKVPETVIVTKRTRQQTGSQIPMLVAGDVSVEATPIRQKPVKRAVSMVEIVDIKCGNPEKAWMKSGLKKLGFSKLSDSNV